MFTMSSCLLKAHAILCGSFLFSLTYGCSLHIKSCFYCCRPTFLNIYVLFASISFPCCPLRAQSHFPLAFGDCISLSKRLVMAAQTRALVSCKWLADAVRNNLVGPKLRILDASWYLPKTKRDPRAEFLQKHIPGSSFFDLDDCCDKTSAFDHMLPTSSHFSQYVGDLGIGNNTHVVVYDTSDFGSFCAPRVWWMFRLFGHSLVSVLDGGMMNWLADGYPVTADYSKPECTGFKATLNQSWVKSYEDVLENIGTKQVQVVDARSAGRFRGTEPEPRDGEKDL